jgi:ribonuclease D
VASDVPAFKILGTEALFTLTDRRPQSPAELAEIRGLSPRVRSQGAALLDAIRRALALPEDQLPTIDRPPRPVVSQATRKRADALKAWRTKEAERTHLEVSVVLPQRLLDPVAERAPRTVEELALVEGIRRWRVEAFGASMVAAITGL